MEAGPFTPVKAYKFLGPGRIGLFSDFAWPPPGVWVETHQSVVDCLVGVHAVRLEHLLDWIDDELWEVELGGAIVERENMIVAERGRLVRHLEAWDAAAARAFADDCARHAAEVAAIALRRAGLVEQADALAGADGLSEVQDAAVAALSGTEDMGVTEAVAFAADMVSLVGGSRPEAWGPPSTAAAAVQSAGAVAANAAFVAAHAAGRAAVAATGTEDEYGSAFAAERRRQQAWFRALLSSAD
jgi:hypothetical protein